MVRDAAHPITFPISMTGDGGKIGMELWPDILDDQRHAVLRAENQVNEIQAEGLRHGGKGRRSIGRAFGPCIRLGRYLGLRPRLAWAGPLARKICVNGVMK